MTEEQAGERAPGYDVVSVNLTQTSGTLDALMADVEKLLEQHPRCWNDYGNGFWVLTRYDEVREAFRDYSTFGNGSISVGTPNPPYRMLPTNAERPMLLHYRKAVAQFFTPPAIAEMTPLLRTLAEQTLHEIEMDGGCEFQHDFAQVFAARVIANMLGLGEDAAQFFLSCTRRMTGSLSAGGDMSDSNKALWDLREYFVPVFSELVVAEPRAGLLSHLAHTTVDNRRLDQDEFLDFAFNLAVGAIHTTESQMGSVFWYLARHRDERRRMVEDADLMVTGIEELCRMYPVVNIGRKIVGDKDFHGCPMKEGQMVMLMIQAANRDPREFPHPDTVRLDRTPNRHITFGASQHLCLGVHLAKAEIRIALETWEARIGDYHVVGTAADLPAVGGHLALVALPLQWTPPTPDS